MVKGHSKMNGRKTLLQPLKNKKEFIKLFIIIIFGVFISFYPSVIKKNMTIKISEQMLKSMENLEGEKLEEARKELEAVLCGQYFDRSTIISQHKTEHDHKCEHDHANENDTIDFFEIEFFHEPWREWKNTYFVWADARNLYYVFMLVFLVKTFGLRRKRKCCKNIEEENS
jgi:hypothetical protein